MRFGLDCLSIFFFKEEEEGSRSFWVRVMNEKKN